MKSEDGQVYTDLPTDNPIVTIRVMGKDGQFSEFPVTKRDDTRPFGKGKLGYNIPGVLEWDGLNFRMSCNLILQGSDSPERIRLAKAQAADADKKKVRNLLTSLGLQVATRERVEELHFGNERMELQEAITFATLEAREGHTPPKKEVHHAPATS